MLTYQLFHILFGVRKGIHRRRQLSIRSYNAAKLGLLSKARNEALHNSNTFEIQSVSDHLVSVLQVMSGDITAAQLTKMFA